MNWLFVAIAFLVGYALVVLYDLAVGDNPWFSIVWPFGIFQKILAWVAKEDPAIAAAVMPFSQKIGDLQNQLAAAAASNAELTKVVGTLQTDMQAVKAKLPV